MIRSMQIACTACEAAKRHPRMELQETHKAMARSQMAHHEMMMKLTRSAPLRRVPGAHHVRDARCYQALRKTAHLPGYGVILRGATGHHRPASRSEIRQRSRGYALLSGTT